jgi:hypothetical protein
MNHSPVPDEEVWYNNSLAQDAEISASEVEFFEALRGEKKGLTTRPLAKPARGPLARYSTPLLVK